MCNNFLICNKPYEKKDGTACFAPYVSISVSSLTGQKSEGVSLEARIDTGADITCIPRIYANTLGPLILGKPLKVRGHDGSIKRVWTYRVVISIKGYPDNDLTKSYRPERGVIITDSSIGLIGMDIISSNWRLIFDSVSREFFIES